MRSVNERFSRFRQFGVADLYQVRSPSLPLQQFYPFGDLWCARPLQGALNLGDLGYNTAQYTGQVAQGIPGKIVNNENQD